MFKIFPLVFLIDKFLLLFFNLKFYDFIEDRMDARVTEAATQQTQQLYQHLDATHELDGVVGGIHTDPEHTLQGLSMENRSINRSIGSHWAKGRAAALEKEVHSLPSQVRLNVRLSICP